MTSTASADVLTKASTEAATDFTEAYYTALQSNRSTIKYYYTPKQSQPDGTSIPDILWNGNQMEDADALQKMFEEEMPSFIFFDVQAVDCQVLNPRYSPDASPAVRPEKNISILVMTNGHVRLEDRKSGPLKEFSETFVLIPNLEKAGGGKGVMANRRSWLVKSQNFRYVVHHHPALTEGQVAMDME